ncbi:hypothetical protein RJ639_005119 [Escallonia herrerae]|uniref:Retrotransposon gag domain-containing protein n=1 Tax=Escallonia herrerae TaxID=1293975 RepID=A0AA89AVY5_9ASTE|nr:hypothetical protein RJ639_005119 [Escallonia herrerae]
MGCELVLLVRVFPEGPVFKRFILKWAGFGSRRTGSFGCSQRQGEQTKPVNLLHYFLNRRSFTDRCMGGLNRRYRSMVPFLPLRNGAKSGDFSFLDEPMELVEHAVPGLSGLQKTLADHQTHDIETDKANSGDSPTLSAATRSFSCEPCLKYRKTVGIDWRTLFASGKSSATHDFLCAIKGHRVSGGIRAAVAQGTVASAKKILWDSLLRKTMANTKERIDALEAQIQGMFKSDQDAPGILKQFSLCLDALEVNLEATDNARYAENMEWEGRFQELQDRVEHHAQHVEGIDWESKFQELQDRVELLSRAVVNTPVGGTEHSSRPRVPEPKSYRGARDAKVLENFLFDIEQYFRAIRVDSEATKVSMAAMYLVGDAKLWWWKKYAEIEDGSYVINPWDILKRELKSQFFPENTVFNARKALLECKHTGSVREYCQAFFALMLDISRQNLLLHGRVKTMGSHRA